MLSRLNCDCQNTTARFLPITQSSRCTSQECQATPQENCKRSGKRKPEDNRCWGGGPDRGARPGNATLSAGSQPDGIVRIPPPKSRFVTRHQPVRSSPCCEPPPSSPLGIPVTSPQVGQPQQLAKGRMMAGSCEVVRPESLGGEAAGWTAHWPPPAVKLVSRRISARYQLSRATAGSEEGQ